MSGDRQTQHRRHCMVVHAYYPEGETRVERQALALVAQGIEVDLICLKVPDQPEREVVEGVHVYRLPVRRYERSHVFAQLLEYLSFFVVAFIFFSLFGVEN